MAGITDHLASLVTDALESMRRDGTTAFESLPAVQLERPKRREHGDWSTNVALSIAGKGHSPRDFANELVDHLPASDMVAGVDVAGPGFINFRLAPAWLHDVVRRAADPSSGFGRSDAGAGRVVNVEFVSANPTGPINVVSGRHAAYGDAVASLLEATGHRVGREYYVNDAGRQMTLFTRSVEARYLQHFGLEAEIPEEGYRGEYVRDLAVEIAAEVGDRLTGVEGGERVAALRDLALARMMDQMRGTLDRFGTRFDTWFSERSLHDSGAVEEALQRLGASGLVEEREGAVWFRSSEFGDDKDRVLVRSDGEPTYLAADAAYMRDKFGRGFDHLVYVLGMDHHGTIARMHALADALGFGRARVEIRLVQLVTLQRGGETVKASKRAGQVVPLDELVEEVGKDAARYIFLMRSLDAPLEFDIELAKEQAPENPVYYVQYAHARICSILRRAGEQGVDIPDVGDVSLDALVHPSEDALMRKLASYEEVLPEAAAMRAPHRIARYVEELAATFSAFYRDCRVVGEDEGVTAGRLALCIATRAVVADGLGLLGVSAPERM
ncbi:MAG TPA: arginine--tRNA ligase [Actinomycetota bacterium]|jgi:arginyl-tRNA synthetase|nr:arginine--tRNA ligase [Actinomycetota bacterium]